MAAEAVPGPCTVLGYGTKTIPTLAAFANGTLAEALDFQDLQTDVLTHNGTPIIPAVIAMAEKLSAPWRNIATAIIAGYETHTRLLRTDPTGSLVPGFPRPRHIRHLRRRSRGRPTVRVRCQANEGRNWCRRRDHAGVQQRQCIQGLYDEIVHSRPGSTHRDTAAYLAQSGFEGVPLEGDPPEFNAPLRTLSDGKPKLELALEDIGEVWHTRRVCYKPYPIGHLIIGPVEIILAILKERRIQPAEVEKIDVVTYGHAVKRTGKYSSPQSTFIDAHFSIPYCVAVALTDGQLTPKQLWKNRVRDPKVHDLASRVVLVEDPSMSALYPKKWPVTLTMHLRSGEKITRHLDEVKWSPERLPSWQELVDKFRMLADPLIGGRSGRARSRHHRHAKAERYVDEAHSAALRDRAH